MIPEKRGMLILLVIATVAIFVGAVWAIVTYLPINITGEARPTKTISVLDPRMNCTHPVSYWTQHAELYPAQIVIGGQVYESNDLERVLSNDTDDPRDNLQSELIAAYLNVHWGADQSYIENVLFEAYGWLVDHPSGSELSESDIENATRLFNLLEAYNDGMTGVEACEIELSPEVTATDAVTLMPTILSTTTPTEKSTTPPATRLPPSKTAPIANTATSVPTKTQAVPSSTPVRPTSTQAYPTSTPSKTTAPPTSIPTKTTEAPIPTNTPIPPTLPFTETPPPPTETLPPP